MSAQRQKDREREMLSRGNWFFPPFLLPYSDGMWEGRRSLLRLPPPPQCPTIYAAREGGGNIRYSANIRDRWLSLVTMWVGQQRLFDGNKELANRPTG